ncbi:ParB N-terminal domain-containing protein [Fusicatenibacter saccharivorans]|uniref:ParB N-terminal domain-containing protein n=1 Tax=Fusicatenibacter saccharivorans TaxID=1150298 RepID=UPI003F936FD6
MKANVPKRKVFQDAVDLISPETVNVVDNGQAMLSVEKIVPFHNHPFRLYEGKRLDDMVESIKEHGLLIPVIVQKIEDGYEMLSGHNRWNSAKIAGITEIPAIIKENLTEREAYVYVIETNMLQRSFDDLLPSEKAAVLAERYEKVMCQGRRNDILEEIAMLNGMDAPETCGHNVHKSKSRDAVGEDYGMTGRNIARYMRLNQTTDQIKKMVDEGTMTMVTAVELSYLSEEEQKQVCTVLDENGGKIKNAQAVELHNEAGSLTADKVKDILVGDTQEKPVSDAKMFAQIKKKYFKGKSTDEIMGVLEQALTTWFAREGEANV